MLPFIGLLMCVLGVLLFVTLSVAALAVGPNVAEGWLPEKDPDRKKKYQSLSSGMEQLL